MAGSAQNPMPDWWKDVMEKPLKDARQQDAENAVRLLLGYVGLNSDDEGLKDTPRRYVTMLEEMTAGARTDPSKLLTTFDGESYDEMIVVKNITFYSLCEHHLLPFHGVAHVGYVPDGRVVGLSKIPRLVECFARRLQMQERLTSQITHALDEHLKPKGSACVIRAEHLCLACRGAKKPGAVMVTASLTGVFRDPSPRAEFYSHVNGGKP